MLLEETSRLPFILGDRKQEHLRRYELVAGLLRFPVGHIEKVGKLPRNVDLATLPFDFRQTADRRIERGLQPAHVDAGAGKQRRGRPILLLQRRQEQVLRFDVRIVMANGKALGIGEGLLKLGRKFVKTHWGS